MRIYIARHGETNYNVLGLHNDDPSVDVHLTELGIKQAHALAEQLKDIPLDHTYISELKRTKQTADIINKYHKCPLSVDARLNDNKSGFEGRPDSEYHTIMNDCIDKWTMRLNDGESLENVRVRVQQFIIDLQRASYNTCLIVTSRIIVQMFYLLIRDLPNESLEDFYIDKGGLVELEICTQ